MYIYICIYIYTHTSFVRMYDHVYIIDSYTPTRLRLPKQGFILQLEPCGSVDLEVYKNPKP